MEPSKKTLGGISHMICAAYFSNLGYKVSIPLFDDAPYDLIVDTGESLKKVQCKTAKVNSEKRSAVAYPVVKLERHSRAKYYTPTDFDYLWVITNENAYLFPVEDMNIIDGHLAQFSITPKHNRYVVDIPILKSSDPKRRMHAANLTEKEESRISSLYLSGESVRGIATIMGLTDSHVESYLGRNKIVKGKLITDEMKREIIRQYESGKRVTDLVNETGFSRSSISKIIKDVNPSRNTKIKDEWKMEILDMYQKGIEPFQIAEKFGTTRVAVSQFICRNKWMLGNDSLTPVSEPLNSD